MDIFFKFSCDRCTRQTKSTLTAIKNTAQLNKNEMDGAICLFRFKVLRQIVTPGQESFNILARTDFLKNPDQIIVRFKIVFFCSFNYGIHNCRGVCAAWYVAEKPVFPADYEWLY